MLGKPCSERLSPFIARSSIYVAPWLGLLLLGCPEWPAPEYTMFEISWIPAAQSNAAVCAARSLANVHVRVTGLPDEPPFNGNSLCADGVFRAGSGYFGTHLACGAGRNATGQVIARGCTAFELAAGNAATKVALVLVDGLPCSASCCCD